MATLQPHTCEHCSRIVIDPAKRRPDGKLVFNVTAEEIVEAGQAGCRLSEWILQGIFEEEDITEEQHSALADFRLFAYVTAVDSKKPWDVMRIEGFGICDQLAEPNNIAADETELDIFSSPGNLAGQYVSTRPINTLADSDAAFDLARTWLDKCTSGHDGCSLSKSVFMPTRVVQVQLVDAEWSLRLVKPPEDSNSPYVALSYCWGGPQPFQTTRGNISQYTEQIIFDCLPQALKDAIIVTAKLDLCFIWIDSLCIVQDDDEDKVLEIAQMPQIYEEATVTIVASRSLSANTGFLHERPLTETLDLVFELPYRCPNGKLGSVTLLRIVGEEGKQPLNERAWALQERLLSPRLLEWTDRQLRWTCHQVQGTPGYTDGWRVASEADRSLPLALQKTCLEELMPYPIVKYFSDSDALQKLELMATSPTDEVRRWLHLIQFYTARRLTVEADRPLAIAGVAESYNSMLQSSYIAGMWRTSLPVGLLWQSASYAEQRSHRRLNECQSPSWSWWAVTGPVSYGTDQLSISEEGNLQLLEFDARAELADERLRYGPVRGGELRLRGRLRQAVWQRGNALRSFHLYWCDGGYIPDQPVASMTFDAWEDDFRDVKDDLIVVHLMEVASYAVSERGETGFQGLILRQLGDGRYSRLGVFVTFGYKPAEAGDLMFEAMDVRRRWAGDFEIRRITVV